MHQKFAVELNVASSKILQKWQFKLSYKSKTMKQPDDMIPPGEHTLNHIFLFGKKVNVNVEVYSLKSL